jgi:hypothetical protein
MSNTINELWILTDGLVDPDGVCKGVPAELVDEPAAVGLEMYWAVLSTL